MKKKKTLSREVNSLELNNNNETYTKDKSPYVYQREKVNFDFPIRELPWTEKQKILIDLIKDKNAKCILIEGPAGTSKTLTAVYGALNLLKTKKISDIVFIRSAVESADSKIGYLPGSIDEKFEAYMVPFMEKLEELLEKGALNRLRNDERFSAMPVNYIRGLHWAAKIVIVDEAQNITFRELMTTITRMGEFSKIIFCGDPMQSDLAENKSGGFSKMCDIFSDEESKKYGIHHFEFTKEDIVRSDFVKFVVNKLENEKDTWKPKQK
jgi:phosphate starvation-inducible PhoH-like protein